MDSDGEYESFQITEDDIAHEFGGRRRRRNRKEDAIYGMWAAQDSDDEERSDVTKGISFVSSSNAKDDDDNDLSDPDEADIDQQVDYIMSSIEQKKIEEGGETTELGGKFQAPALERNRELHLFPTQPEPTQTKKKKTNVDKKPNTLAQKKKKELMVSDRDWGRWEKHTTGFGSKMLQKMGYVPGQGLGRRGEGIVNPVKASKVKELGTESERMPMGHRAMPVVDSEEEEEEEAFQEELQQWRTSGDKKTTSVKYTFKTLEELRGESHSDQPTKAKGNKGNSFLGGESKVKVIDMTGRKARVLSSYGDLKDQLAKTSDTTEQLFLPELMHNLDLLVESTEHDIVQNDRQYHYNQDLVVNLTHEGSRLQEELVEEQQQIEKLTEILTVVDTFEQRVRDQSSTLTLTECESLLSNAQQRFPHEYKVYELSALAVAVVFPLFKSILSGWNVLSDPSGPIALFRQWKTLLREQDSSSQTIPDINQMDPYDRLMWEVWMVNIREVLRNWQPKTEVEGVVDLIQTWMPLLPDWIINNILDSIIMPRLQTEVDRWDPTSDPMPLHLWIHPWQPLMESQLGVLYPTIRRKLGVALNNLQPMDYSPHVILKPWIKVFSPGVMEAFLARTVLPKLVYCLQTLVINPQNEHIDPVKWIFSWTELIPAHHFVDMFVKYFFPKWLQILATWLQGNPNYDEVTKWFYGWKSLFPKEMLSDSLVKSNFDRALSLMDHAVQGTLVPGMRENIAYFITSERRAAAEAQRPSPKMQLQPTTTIGFKDIVERKAEDFGLPFIPTSKKYEGKTVYNFGSASVYIDRGVLFVMQDRRWSPISLDDLVQSVI